MNAPNKYVTRRLGRITDKLNPEDVLVRGNQVNPVLPRIGGRIVLGFKSVIRVIGWILLLIVFLLTLPFYILFSRINKYIPKITRIWDIAGLLSLLLIFLGVSVSAVIAEFFEPIIIIWSAPVIAILFAVVAIIIGAVFSINGSGFREIIGKIWFAAGCVSLLVIGITLSINDAASELFEPANLMWDVFLLTAPLAISVALTGIFLFESRGRVQLAGCLLIIAFIFVVASHIGTIAGLQESTHVQFTSWKTVRVCSPEMPEHGYSSYMRQRIGQNINTIADKINSVQYPKIPFIPVRVESKDDADVIRRLAGWFLVKEETSPKCNTDIEVGPGSAVSIVMEFIFGYLKHYGIKIFLCSCIVGLFVFWAYRTTRTS